MLETTITTTLSQYINRKEWQLMNKLLYEFVAIPFLYFASSFWAFDVFISLNPKPYFMQTLNPKILNSNKDTIINTTFENKGLGKWFPNFQILWK
jgi:hypothetical protein